ncbi:MAG: tRNA glutamyl-Q(34) synthetase GluQRS [Pseudomonadota bacterium]
METVTRFAPSPNGSLHLGHAYSAIVAHDLAKAAGGAFLLRIEDIDGPRSRPELADEFRRDLEWLGLEWHEVPAQSTRLASYRAAAKALVEQGLAYRCTCTRAEIKALPPRRGPDGFEYPGSPRGLTPEQPRYPDEPAALRLDIDRAMKSVGELVWTDDVAGASIMDPREFGDVVIVRKDLPASYHLAATLDDAADGVTLVTRGMDLFTSTHVHRLLQELFRLPVPHWHHHKLLLDENGEKLAKRRGSPPLSERRENGEDGSKLADELRETKISTGT